MPLRHNPRIVRGNSNLMKLMVKFTFNQATRLLDAACDSIIIIVFVHPKAFNICN